MQSIYCGQAQPCSARLMRSAHPSSSGTTAVRATTAIDMDTSRRRARVRSDVLSARKVTVEMNARTKTARSARHAATHTRCLTGRASCTRSITDTSASKRQRRGRVRAVPPWMSTCMAAACERARRPRPVLEVGHRLRARQARRTHPVVLYARRTSSAAREHRQAKDGALESVL